MAQGRGYSVSSGLVAVTSTAQTPILFATAGATVSADAIGIRVSCPSGASSPTFPSNSSVKFTLAKTTSGVGNAQVTPGKANNLDIAANTLWYNTFTTAPTIGQIVWEHNLAFAAGADWGEVFPSNLERRLGGTGSTDQWAVYVTLSSSSTSTDFEAGIDFIE
jgi:hypothetical protein